MLFRTSLNRHGLSVCKISQGARHGRTERQTTHFLQSEMITSFKRKNTTEAKADRREEQGSAAVAPPVRKQRFANGRTNGRFRSPDEQPRKHRRKQISTSVLNSEQGKKRDGNCRQSEAAFSFRHLDRARRLNALLCPVFYKTSFSQQRQNFSLQEFGRLRRGEQAKFLVLSRLRFRGFC